MTHGKSHTVDGYIYGVPPSYEGGGSYMTWSAHGVPRDVFDLIPVKAKARSIKDEKTGTEEPFWRKDWTVRRNGTRMELSFFTNEPPVADPQEIKEATE